MEGLDSSTWDKKKVAIGVFILCIVFWIGYENRGMIGEYNKKPVQEVAGSSTKNDQSTDTQKKSMPNFDIQQKITEITTQVSNLNAVEVAASSPQIQKVLKDMEGLKSLPQNQAKDACIKICSSL
jgi:predicted lipid-binding transport protein (Tim44 family)